MLCSKVYCDVYLVSVSGDPSPVIIIRWWSWWPPSWTWGPVAPALAPASVGPGSGDWILLTVRTQTSTSDEPCSGAAPEADRADNLKTDSSHYAEWWRGRANPGCHQQTLANRYTDIVTSYKQVKWPSRREVKSCSISQLSLFFRWK